MSVDPKSIITVEDLEYTKQTTDAGIAPVETSSTASKAYKVGERFWFKGKLCICTVDIASGGTITLNTNCKLDVLGDDLTSQSEKIDDVNSIITFTRIAETEEASSWRLKSSGLSASNSSYTILKYSVTAGTTIYIKSAVPPSDGASYQFQNVSNVSSSSTAAIIGSPVLTQKIGFVTVPTGATYLMLSVLKSDTVSGVYTNGIDDIRDEIDDLQNALGVNSPSYATTSGKYIYYPGGNESTGSAYKYTSPIAFSKGQTAHVKCTTYSVNVSAIFLCNSDGTGKVGVVQGKDGANQYDYYYTSQNDGYFGCSYNGNYPAIIEVLDSFSNVILDHRVEALENNTETSIISLNHGFKPKVIQGKMRKNVNSEYSSLPTILSLLHFSDIHADKTALERIVQFKNFYSSYIDDAICTGDMVSNEFSDGMAFWSAVSGADDIMTCIGNHDIAANGDYAHYGVTTEQAYNQYFSPYISNWDVEHTGSLTYYYKDYATQKIRLIVLDAYLTGDDATAQNTWLSSALTEAKTNEYAVVCAVHTPPTSATKINCTFTSIINDTSSTFGDPYQATVDSFIEDDGKFLCWLCGHVHNDYVEYNSNYPDQPFIAVTCAKTWTGYEEANRVVGDRSQDAFNVVCLDGGSSLVKLIRVGQDRDSMLRHLDTLTLDVSESPATVVWND